MENKYALDAQEDKLHFQQEGLKRQNKLLDIETQLASATAKIAILESSVESGSAPSDGMNSNKLFQQSYELKNGKLQLQQPPSNLQVHVLTKGSMNKHN